MVVAPRKFDSIPQVGDEVDCSCLTTCSVLHRALLAALDDVDRPGTTAYKSGIERSNIARTVRGRVAEARFGVARIEIDEGKEHKSVFVNFMEIMPRDDGGWKTAGPYNE
ncbi:hypothetical protein HN709_03900 [Candidatus Peregrinibacteria bacterium]|jgi:hypothetical protein|nr:hypothetical protein [Candidatus Peregrinibacteria bacterium]